MDIENNEPLLQILNLISTIPSIIGSLLVFYFCQKSISQNTSIKLILALSISDFFYSISNLMIAFKYSEDNPACQIEAILRSVSVRMAIWIASSISIFHYKMIKADPDFNKDRFVSLALGSGLIVSLLAALRYSSTSSYLSNLLNI